MRVLADDMEPYAGQGTCIQTSSFRVPTLQGQQFCGFGAQGGAFPQFNPTVASINGNYYIASQDVGTSATSITIRSFDPIFNLSQASAVLVSDASSSVAQLSPSMAPNGNNLFVAWESSGTIVGKMFDSGTLNPPATAKTLGTGTGVTVAATSSGWVAVYTNGSDVEMVPNRRTR